MTRETWFTSDTHFSHRKIIEYCKRPFTSVEEMDETLIKNWNERVKPGDLVYHLGDVGFSQASRLRNILRRLKGEKHLTPGNHDKKPEELADQWASIAPYREIYVGKQFIVLFHYAQRVWNRSHHGSVQLYGHSHGNMPGNSQSLDVGVDCWNYQPVNFDEIRARLATLPKFTGYAQQSGGGDHHVRSADL